MARDGLKWPKVEGWLNSLSWRYKDGQKKEMLDSVEGERPAGITKHLEKETKKRSILSERERYRQGDRQIQAGRQTDRQT